MKALYTIPSLFLGFITIQYLGLALKEFEKINQPLGFEMFFSNLNNAINPNFTSAFTALILSFALFFVYTMLAYSHIQKKNLDESM